MRAPALPSARRWAFVRALLLALVLVPAAVVQAGHELPFYPSYYPQEIRLETLAPQAAAAQLKAGTLHAYLGGDPFAGSRVPADVRSVESLGGYLVLTFNPAAPGLGSPRTRCEAARRVARDLAPPGGSYVPYPYPVTPYHMDYLQQFDLAQSAKKAYRTGPVSGPALKLRAKGAVAERLVKAAMRSDGKDWDAAVEEMELGTLLADHSATLDGWLGPPWLKEGWFHAYLLLAGSLTDPGAKQEAEALYARLAGGAYGGAAERMELERQLVSRLSAGCERVVLGYSLRRESFNAEFSQGIENVAWDSQAGFTSAIFVRTAKLKDFPWNGWLRLGIAARPVAAWNPVGGFGDPAGRLIWAAVGDPGFFPAPYGGGWVANRATAASVTAESRDGIDVPEDALLPEPGTGMLRPVGKGKTARAKIVYRVSASAAHDNTRVTAADALYPYVFTFRWGVKRSQAGSEYDPAVDAATALARQALAGFRVTGVDSEVKKYSDITFTYVVPVIEVYLNASESDAQELAALAPPWSPVPWHVMALMEEAVRRGVGAFSPAEARRRGVRWLDLARDHKTKEELALILDELARKNYIPEPLKRLVTADEAQTRWTALRQFFQRRGHFLVTSGPYQLDKWSDGAVVLQVFRDFNNPMGVGRFDRFAIPRRAYVSRVVARADRLEVAAEIERVEKFLRDYRIVREPLAAGADPQDVPQCRYVLLGADGVAAAGTSQEAQGDRLIVSLKGKVKPGVYTVMVALALGDNYVDPEVTVAQLRVEAAP